MIRDSNEFVALLRAERKRLGAKDSGIMESMATMDSSDTTRYDVVMIPRKPQNARPQGSSTTPEQQGYHR